MKRLKTSTCAVKPDVAEVADLRRTEGKQKRQCPDREEKAERAAEEGEEQAFGQ